MLIFRYILKDIRLILELSSALTLEMLGKPFLLEKRIVLLHAIQEHGSISKAAKAVPMSYKSAWEAVDAMNSLSPEPIVCRETGGKDGGGTTITGYGETLLKNYDLLKEEHTRFLARLSELTNIQSGTFQTIGRLAMQLSARNQIQVEVLSITSNGVNADIALKLKSGNILTSTVTAEAVDNLHLYVGETVTAICKSSTVHINNRKHKEKCNYVKGTVLSVEEDVANIKVLIDIGSHDKIVSVMSKKDILDVVWSVGNTIEISIKNNDIMLGK